MIANERIREYIDSLDLGHSRLIEAIRQQAVSEDVPIIKRDTESLLLAMLAAIDAKNALEVGTGVAYSAIAMADAFPSVHITTIEKYPPRIKKAKENIKLASMEDRITLIEGDAGDILKELTLKRAGSFDFIFMDAAKAQYINWLEMAIALLRAGGMLFSDNVLLEGSIIESRYIVDRRDRTIHTRMREYLYKLKRDERLITSIVTIGDGAAISIKRKDDEAKC